MVFLSHLYLVRGDAWVAATPAVEIVYQRDIMTFFERSAYPSMLGFIVAGFAAATGLPAINANAALFPLAALNALNFFVLAKIVFKRNEEFATMAATIFCFGGGISWLLYTLWLNQTMSIWTVAFNSQDSYFFPFAWNAIDFSYKMMASGFTFISFSLFSVANGINCVKARLPLISASAVLFLLGFMVHILPGFTAPVFVIIALLAQDRRRGIADLGVLIAIGVALFLLVDTIMGGYYTLLLSSKVPLLSLISTTRLVIFTIAGVSIVVLIFIIYKLRHRASALPFPNSFVRRSKVLISFSIALVYVGSLYYWSIQPPLQDSYLTFTFPWYLYVTRYGIVGLLAIVGMVSTSWRNSWFKLSTVWIIIMIALGSLWWGERLNAYLFPALAILAACGAISIFRWISKRRIGGHLMKPLAYVTVGAIIVLASTSTLLLDYRYAISESPTSDALVRFFVFVQEETPANSTFLVPPPYSTLEYDLWRGMSTLADRYVITAKTSHIEDARDFRKFILDAERNPFQYVVFPNSITREDAFYAHFETVFSNDYVSAVYVPAFTPPKEYAQVAVLDERLDLSGLWGFSQLNGAPPSSWATANLAVSLNGFLTRLQWDYSNIIIALPNGSMALQVSPAGSMSLELGPFTQGEYSDFTLHYRVASGSSANAVRNAQVAITVYNSSQIFHTFNLPLYSDGKFHDYTSILPSGFTSISGINVTITNDREGNGTLLLELDYMLLELSNPLEPSFDAWFYSMAIPALWNESYFLADPTGARYSDVLFADLNRVSQGFISYSTTRSFILFNDTAEAPQWGEGWHNAAFGIIVGSYSGKQVVIMSTSEERLKQGGFESYASILNDVAMHPG